MLGSCRTDTTPVRNAMKRWDAASGRLGGGGVRFKAIRTPW